VPIIFDFSNPEMIQEFVARNLHKTVDFLSRVGIASDEIALHLPTKEYLSLSYQSLKEYKKTYFYLLCETSRQHLEEIVFCSCCSARVNFIRNNNLLLLLCSTIRVHWMRSNKDEYLLYLEGKATRSHKILLDVVILNPWFWEAYMELAELTTPENVKSIEIIGGLSDFFFMYLFCTKMIRKDIEYRRISGADDSTGSDYLEKINSNWKVMPDGFRINMKYPNLAGAVYYHLKDFGRCIEVFEEITRNTVYFDLDYVDLYSNALYIKNDPAVITLAENALRINKYRSETMCCIANYYSMKKEHHKAIEHFRLSIRLNPSSSIINTLIGHEYLEMKDMEKAISAYNQALRTTPMDYRAWYSIGQAYSAMAMYEYALFFFKKALECKNNDSVVWLALGQCFISLNRVEEAIRCFKSVVALRDAEGYLYIGDAYKSIKMYNEAVLYYEKYVEHSKENTQHVCLFLEEYFRKICDDKKSACYARLAHK
jgi:anaphase-promoting complex subunit 8